MSAPPLFRRVDERRVSVVRDAAAVRQVLDADPVGSLHGRIPGGRARRRSQCDRRRTVDAGAGHRVAVLRRCQPHSVARSSRPTCYAFADKAVSAARRCSSLVGRAELVLPMWQQPRARLGSRARRAGASAVDGACHRPAPARTTPRCGRCASTSSTPTWWPPSTCSSGRSVSIRASATVAAATGDGSQA